MFKNCKHEFRSEQRKLSDKGVQLLSFTRLLSYLLASLRFPEGTCSNLPLRLPLRLAERLAGRAALAYGPRSFRLLLMLILFWNLVLLLLLALIFIIF